MDLPDPPSPQSSSGIRARITGLLLGLTWAAGSLLAYRRLGYYPPKSSVIIFAAWPLALVAGFPLLVRVKDPNTKRSLIILGFGSALILPSAAVTFVPGLKQLETHPIPGRPTIAVAARPGGHSNLYLIHGSNDDIVQLTDSPQTEGSADLSPDGHRIAFTDDRFGTQDVFVADLQAGDTLKNELRLTDALGNEESLTWSPDGTQLLFQHRAENRSNVWTLAASGGEPTKLTNDGTSWNPALSPDGSHIVYAGPNPADPTNLDLWVMLEDGTHSRRLIDTGGDDFMPVWSPDGSRIEFTSEVGGSRDVWIVEADGTNPRSLTPESPDDDQAYDWTDDGRYVLFTSDRSHTGGRFLYFMPADGGETELAVII